MHFSALLAIILMLFTFSCDTHVLSFLVVAKIVVVIDSAEGSH